MRRPSPLVYCAKREIYITQRGAQARVSTKVPPLLIRMITLKEGSILRFLEEQWIRIYLHLMVNPDLGNWSMSLMPVLRQLSRCHSPQGYQKGTPPACIKASEPASTRQWLWEILCPTGRRSSTINEWWRFGVDMAEETSHWQFFGRFSVHLA